MSVHTETANLDGSQGWGLCGVAAWACFVFVVLQLLLPALSVMNAQAKRSEPPPAVKGLFADTLRERLQQKDTLTRGLDREIAAMLLARAKQLPPVKAAPLKRILASGGPWVPVLIKEMQRFDPGCLKEIFHLLLDKRPIRRELLPEGSAATTFIDPFHNARTGEGIFITFSGIGFGPVSLEQLLDQINDAVRPEFPLVLSPELGGSPELFVTEKPLDGAGALCLDHLLSSLGLGITYLETVALVERGGGHGYNQTVAQQKEDSMLFDAAMHVLSSPLSSESARKAAFKALAYLDLPGLVEGYLQDLSNGKLDPCLDIVLYGPCFHQLVAGLILSDDVESGTALMQACCTMSRADPRRRRLEKLIFSLTPGLIASIADRVEVEEDVTLLPFMAAAGKADEKQIMTCIQSKDSGLRRIGFEASLQEIIRYGSVAYIQALYHALCTWTDVDHPVLRLAESDMLPALSRFLDDEKLAFLIERSSFHVAAMNSAKSSGGIRCARACLNRLAGPEGDLAALLCAHAIYQRMSFAEQAGFKEEAVNFDHDSDGSRKELSLAGEACLAGLKALLAPGREQEVPAAERFRDLVSGDLRTAMLGAQLFAIFTDGRIIDHLRCWVECRQRADPILRRELEKSILRSAGRDPMKAERIRLALKEWEDTLGLQDLDRFLSCVAGMFSLDSYTVVVEI
ncbi:MAG: hypothetical protein ABIK28_13195 [Planctomycetota bacterium]